MSNLSDHVGFSSGGGGGADTFTGTLVLDKGSFNLQDESSYLQDTNLNSYSQAVRIRGLDDQNKAYFGFNCMTQTSPGGGQMRHTFTLFSVNQTTGAITKEGVRHLHTNSSYYYDYSTMNKTSDEWTGRYTYHGNIPHSGQSHTYSYHTCFIYGTGSSSYTSNHSNWSSYPHSNEITHNSYVAPNERRIGGATNHVLGGYNSSSQARVFEFDYGYSGTSLNMQSNGSEPLTSTNQTSTNYQVALIPQWGTTNEPYYDAFHSFREGLYGRVRTSQSWQQISSSYGLSESYMAFFLSNGATVLKLSGSETAYIDSSGNLSSIPAINQHPAVGAALYNYAPFVVNVGQDEYLQWMPGGKFMKFKFNPSNGHATLSNTKVVSELEYAGYDTYAHYSSGLYSSFSTTSVNKAGCMFTFGNDHSSGYGYGVSKMVWIGGHSQDKSIKVQSYDISTLLSELTYP